MAKGKQAAAKAARDQRKYADDIDALKHENSELRTEIRRIENQRTLLEQARIRISELDAEIASGDTPTALKLAALEAEHLALIEQQQADRHEYRRYLIRACRGHVVFSVDEWERIADLIGEDSIPKLLGKINHGSNTHSGQDGSKESRWLKHKLEDERPKTVEQLIENVMYTAATIESDYLCGDLDEHQIELLGSLAEDLAAASIDA